MMHGTFGVMVQAFKQKRELRREAQEVPGGFFQIGATDPAGISNPDLVGVYAPGLHRVRPCSNRPATARAA